MLTPCESKVASSSEKLIHTNTFFVSVQKEQIQSKGQNQLYSSISSDGILISTDPEQTSQKQDKDWYALLSSVLPKKSISSINIIDASHRGSHKSVQ